MQEKSIGFVSLGCPKALVDSERIITQLRAEGYHISPSYQYSDLVIINTCGFIEPAKEESLDAIEEALHENGNVIVTGCLGAQADHIKKYFPEVLAITGPHDYEAVMQAVHEYLPKPQHPFFDIMPDHGIKLTPKHYAYLKISEGCNHSCSFCIIPSLRGDLQSYPLHTIMQEAENLVKAGVKELLVISQDTSAYGVDIRYRTDFWQGRPEKSHITQLTKLLGELGVWVRLHYVYPYPHIDDLIPLMQQNRVLPYLDVPLQHASDKILKSMRRPAASAKMLERIQKWRSICPDIVLRSTFIVGFPGETEADFNELLAFLEVAQLDRVGCFIYDPVEGATANNLSDHLPEPVRLERQERLMALQASISQKKLSERIGKTLTVLIDDEEDDTMIARSYGEAPEIDGYVYVQKTESLLVGNFAQVKIIDSDEHDLYAITQEL